MKLARQVYRGAGFFGLTFTCGSLVLAGVTRAEGDLAKSRARDLWAGRWSRGLLELFGVDIVVHGDPGLPGVGRDKGRVVVSNHRSIIDIAILLSEFGGAMLSRGDLEKWPIMGPAARSAGTIFVDRSSRASGGKALEAMIARLEMNDTICLFPEGTTYVDDEVRPFKPGAAVAATRARVPIVPVALVYPKGSGAAFGGESFPSHLARLADTPRTVVDVEIGAEVWPAEGESVPALSERCRADVARLLARGRARSTATA